MKKPNILTEAEVRAGGIPAWSDRYAQWMSELPSYRNMTNRARVGRVRAVRALEGQLSGMLERFPELNQFQILSDINALAKVKANAVSEFPIYH